MKAGTRPSSSLDLDSRARPGLRAQVLGLLIAAALPLCGSPALADPAFAKAGPKSDIDAGDPRGIVLQAMEKELTRSKAALCIKGYEAPYFISYLVADVHRRFLAARFGAIQAEGELHNRQASVEVRVGSYELDSCGVDPTDYDRHVAYSPSDQVPVEDDPKAIRSVLWLLTEQSYKEAIAAYLKKKARKIYSAKEDEPDSFSREAPLHHIEPRLSLELDIEAAKGSLRRLSAQLLETPEVFDASLQLGAQQLRRWQVNTEGSRVLTESLLYSLQVIAYTRAEDGMLLENGRSYYAPVHGELPKEEELKKELDEMVRDLLALRNAPLLDPCVVPAILEPEAAGVLFHEAIGHRLEGQRQREDYEGQTFRGRLGHEILPSFLSVEDDPTLRAWGEESLIGYYLVDEEAVLASKVLLVDKGVLRGFLMSRSPIESVSLSNGHGRAQLGSSPVGRMSNLIIRSESRISEEELKVRLMAETRRQGKPYGLLIRDMSGGSTNTSTFGFQAFKGMSRMVWKVDAKSGEETLVRGVEIVGTPLASINKILVTSEETGVFNGYCGAESGSIPVSMVAPAVLIEELELQRATRDEDRRPLLPPPWLPEEQRPREETRGPTISSLPSSTRASTRINQCEGAPR